MIISVASLHHLLYDLSYVESCNCSYVAYDNVINYWAIILSLK